MTTLLYLYAVLPAGSGGEAALQRGELTGVGGAPARAVREGDLTGAAGDVRAEDYGAPDGTPAGGAHDLAWLAPRATAHQTVNARLFDLADAVLPLSFGTLFHDEASLRRMLRDRGAELRAGLERVRRRGEWVVTVFREELAAAAVLEQSSAALRRLQEEIAHSSPGRQYLLRRRVEGLRDEERRAQDVRVTQDVWELLSTLAEDVYREPVEAVAPGSDGGGVAIARASLLVPREAEPALFAAATAAGRRWDSAGYGVRHTGPWPAYRFGGLSIAPPAAETAGARR